MFSRSAAFFLLLSSVTALSQDAAPSNPHVPKIFHDQALSVTYSYPGVFTPVAITPVPATPPATEKPEPQCVRSTLSAGAPAGTGSSVFVLSSIDNTCPGILNAASQKLGSFTREQILRQLKKYGTPSITQEPTRYNIDGHPAAITMASAEPENTPPGKLPTITYAAKACVLGSIPEKSGKSNPASSIRHVLCFDFTAPQKDLLTQMLAFTIQFDERPPQALVPGSVLR
jgi:hypothetical protein